MIRRLILGALLALCLIFLLGTRYYPLVERVEVTGNQYYNREELMLRANVFPGDAFLWVTSVRLQELLADPWIERVRVIRHWPHTVSITVWEREPLARKGDIVYARDGTVLPNVKDKESLVSIEGWGEDRTVEALGLIRLLAPYGPRVLSYSPSGFNIHLIHTETHPETGTVLAARETWLFTDSMTVLQRHWAGFTSHEGERVAVYPWGVSVLP